MPGTHTAGRQFDQSLGKPPGGIDTTEDIVVNLDRGANTAATLLPTEYSFPATVTIPAGGTKYL